MLDIQLRFLVADRPVELHGFVQALAFEVAKAVGIELQRSSQVQISYLAPVRSATGKESKRTRPLAVSVSEAARFLGISTATVRSYVASRRIHSVRVGGKILIPTQLLDQVMEQGVAKARR